MQAFSRHRRRANQATVGKARRWFRHCGALLVELEILANPYAAQCPYDVADEPRMRHIGRHSTMGEASVPAAMMRKTMVGWSGVPRVRQDGNSIGLAAPACRANDLRSSRLSKTNHCRKASSPS